jgi:hypothetical protein
LGVEGHNVQGLSRMKLTPLLSEKLAHIPSSISTVSLFRATGL